MKRELTGIIKSINELAASEIEQMFTLMNMFYDHMHFNTFIKDLNDKQTCIILLDEKKQIKGFSTQKVLTLHTHTKTVHGVFSGDTIIHRNDWGSWVLFQTFARHFIEESRKYDDFYWFLISKGYKTYKILPLFYKEYYPNYMTNAPDYIRQIINAFGQIHYPGDFNPDTGVIEYKYIKDKLKTDVGAIGQKHLNDPDIAFFCSRNPGHINGNDLVCLTQLTEDNLTARGKKLLSNCE